MRWMLILLVIACLALQGQLWLSAEGYQKTRSLRAAVAGQIQQNQELRQRNESLDAEVVNLKQGRAAAEERARTDLGMIGKSETFFQVIPAGDSRIIANASQP